MRSRFYYFCLDREREATLIVGPKNLSLSSLSTHISTHLSTAAGSDGKKNEAVLPFVSIITIRGLVVHFN